MGARSFNRWIEFDIFSYIRNMDDIKIQEISIDKIKENPDNPRVIKDHKFKELVQSIKESPWMLALRPIVLNDEHMALGGNQRTKACKEAGMKKVPVIYARDLTKEQQKEFIIKDNVSFGQWDWGALANDWSKTPLQDWGLEIHSDSDVDLKDFFEDHPEERKVKNKIVLEYSEEEFTVISEKLNGIEGSKEKIIWDLLGL